MRVNTTKSFNAWVQGKRAKPAASVWTDGTIIYSYGTPILTREESGRVKLNRHRYSVTTTIHQNGLRNMLALNGIAHIEYDPDNS